jgi:chromosome segregation ATPase
MSQYEEAWREIHNFISRFGVLKETLEKAKEAEVFLASSDDEVAKRQKDIAELDAVIATRKADITSYGAIIEKLNEEHLTARNAGAAAAKQAEADLNAYRAKAANAIAVSTKELSDLAAQRTALNDEITGLKATLDSQKAALTEIQARISRATAALQ